MTAYGRSCIVCPAGRFVVEIQSVNRKHLEVSTFLPKEFLRFDVEIKKWIAAEIVRGQVNVRVWAFFENSSPLLVRPNIPLARQIKAAWNEIIQELSGVPNDALAMELLSREEGLLIYDEDHQDEESYREALHKAVSEALHQAMQMKICEGEALYNDISGRLEKIAHLIKEVALKAPGATERYRQRLIARLKEFPEVDAEHQERILREVCLYAEKIDIAEELTRFDSHLKQVDILLHSEAAGVSKTFEFLVQELNREINTISSKSSDVDVSRYVIDIKSELERIREQIQNIE